MLMKGVAGRGTGDAGAMQSEPETEPQVPALPPCIDSLPSVLDTLPTVSSTTPPVSDTRPREIGTLPLVPNTTPRVLVSRPAVSDTAPCVSNTPLTRGGHTPVSDTLPNRVQHTIVRVRHATEPEIERAKGGMLAWTSSTYGPGY